MKTFHVTIKYCIRAENEQEAIKALVNFQMDTTQYPRGVLEVIHKNVEEIDVSINEE